MNHEIDPQLEALLDAIAFGQESDQQLPAELLAQRHGKDLPANDLRAFERAAALAAAAFAAPETPPPAVANRLAASALRFCAERSSSAGPRSAGSGSAGSGSAGSGSAGSGSAGPATAAGNARPGPSPAIQAAPRPFLTSATRPPRSGASFGFLAGLAAAALLWLMLGGDRPSQGTNPNEARSALLARSGVQQLAWKAGPSPLAGQVRGDVVWSPTEQTGYLTFEGLPPLGPEQRFQLWIVDGERPGSAPVDGGLFDIRGANGSTVVPIDPKLPVRKAAAFVVTVEGKDGAVVSKQEHVVAIAGL